MYIPVRRHTVGQISGALAIIGLSVFALSALDTSFGPVAVFAVAMGALVAIALRWQRSKGNSLSIRDHEQSNPTDESEGPR